MNYESTGGVERPEEGCREENVWRGYFYGQRQDVCRGCKDEIMVRIDPEVYEGTLRRKGCREMNFTGKPMKGFVFINPEGTSNKNDLDDWIDLALDFNKKAKISKKRK